MGKWCIYRFCLSKGASTNYVNEFFIILVKLSIIKNEYMSVYENECIILIKLSRISVLEN